jgi:predicted MFS family arabinose efflux permease
VSTICVEAACRAPAAVSRAYAWYAVVVLALCQILASIDSRLPFIMVEELKRDLTLSDMQIGLLTGPAFALTYALCAVPIARLSDRGNRIVVISIAIVVWSGFTAFASLSRTFGAFAFTRIGVAAGESALTPAAHSIIAGYLPGPSRARGLAVYSVGVAVGAFIAFGVGGYVVDRFGWRTAFLLIGCSGAALVLLLTLTVREPRREADASANPRQRGRIADLLKNPVIRHIIFGGTLLGFSAGALNAWGPAYVMRTFHLSATQTGATYGAVAGILAIVGILAGGFIGSWLSERDPRYALRMLTVAFVIAMLSQIGALLTTSYPLFLGLLAVTILLSSFYLAPTFAAIQSAVDPSTRSFASAVTLFGVNGVGVASGSFVVGMLSDLLSASLAGDSLKGALLAVTVFKLWSAGHYWNAARNMPAPRTAQI